MRYAIYENGTKLASAPTIEEARAFKTLCEEQDTTKKYTIKPELKSQTFRRRG